MALDSCCETVIGGEVYFYATFNNSSGGDGQNRIVRYEALGEVRIQPAAIERTAGASSAGTVWVTEASRPIRAVMSFVNRCTPNPMRLFCERCKVDITIVEKSRGITHNLSECIIVGSPEINFATGEISGMEIVCAGPYSVSGSNAEPYAWCQTSIYDYSGSQQSTPANPVGPGAGI